MNLLQFANLPQLPEGSVVHVLSTGQWLRVDPAATEGYVEIDEQHAPLATYGSMYIIAGPDLIDVKD
jgi:hypothetical protein